MSGPGSRRWPTPCRASVTRRGWPRWRPPGRRSRRRTRSTTGSAPPTPMRCTRRSSRGSSPSSFTTATSRRIAPRFLQGGYGIARYTRRYLRAHRPAQIVTARISTGRSVRTSATRSAWRRRFRHGAGAQAGFEGHPVIGITGDAGFGYTAMEVETLSKYRLPAVIVVYNNNAWGTWSGQRNNAVGLPVHLFQENLRYDKLGEALGAHGEYVTRPDEMRPALETRLPGGARREPAERRQRPGPEGVLAARSVRARVPRQGRARGDVVLPLGCADVTADRTRVGTPAEEGLARFAPGCRRTPTAVSSGDSPSSRPAAAAPVFVSLAGAVGAHAELRPVDRRAHVSRPAPERAGAFAARGRAPAVRPGPHGGRAAGAPARRSAPRGPAVLHSPGVMSVEVVAKAGQHGYGVNRAVNLVHEIFVHLQTYFPEYMWESFDAPQE